MEEKDIKRIEQKYNITDDSINQTEKDFERNLKFNGNSNEKNNGSQDNTKIYDDIFREMLNLEKSRSMSNRVKYCLVKVMAKTSSETASLQSDENKHLFLFQFSEFLFKNLRKKDIYMMAEPGSFLILFPEISVDNMNIVMKKMHIALEKEYRGKIKFKWELITSTDNEDDIKPFIKKAKLISEVRNELPTKKSDKILSDAIGFKSLFKYFLISYIVFTVIIVSVSLLIYIAGRNLGFTAGSFGLGEIFTGWVRGLGSIDTGLNKETTDLLNFVFAVIVIFFIFGFGILTGFIAVLRFKSKNKFDSRV
jgi:hypothetical protein